MLDRYFVVHPAEGGFNLVCYDCGAPMGGGFYASFPLPAPFPDPQGSGVFRDAGLAGAALDGRCFIDTGMVP